MEENRNTEVGLQQEKEEPLTLSEREELEKLRKEKNIKERLYDKVTISVKTMDRIIAALVILFLIVVIAGIFAGR